MRTLLDVDPAALCPPFFGFPALINTPDDDHVHQHRHWFTYISISTTFTTLTFSLSAKIVKLLKLLISSLGYRTSPLRWVLRPPNILDPRGELRQYLNIGWFGHRTPASAPSRGLIHTWILCTNVPLLVSTIISMTLRGKGGFSVGDQVVFALAVEDITQNNTLADNKIRPKLMLFLRERASGNKPRILSILSSDSTLWFYVTRLQQGSTWNLHPRVAECSLPLLCYSVSRSFGSSCRTSSSVYTIFQATDIHQISFAVHYNDQPSPWISSVLQTSHQTSF